MSVKLEIERELLGRVVHVRFRVAEEDWRQAVCRQGAGPHLQAGAVDTSNPFVIWRALEILMDIQAGGDPWGVIPVTVEVCDKSVSLLPAGDQR